MAGGCGGGGEGAGVREVVRLGHCFYACRLKIYVVQKMFGRERFPRIVSSQKESYLVPSSNERPLESCRFVDHAVLLFGRKAASHPLTPPPAKLPPDIPKHHSNSP